MKTGTVATLGAAMLFSFGAWTAKNKGNVDKTVHEITTTLGDSYNFASKGLSAATRELWNHRPAWMP